MDFASARLTSHLRLHKLLYETFQIWHSRNVAISSENGLLKKFFRSNNGLSSERTYDLRTSYISFILLRAWYRDNHRVFECPNTVLYSVFKKSQKKAFECMHSNRIDIKMLISFFNDSLNVHGQCVSCILYSIIYDMR
jgi:hypothetical protein